MKKCNDECPTPRGEPGPANGGEQELPPGVGLMSTEDGLSVAFNTEDGKTWQFLLSDDYARDLAKMILAVVGD